MKNKKIIKIIVTVVVAGLIIVGGTVLYLFNMPHRDVQATKADFLFSASSIVVEYLSDANAANEKYLDEEGESKILEVTGAVAEVSEDYNGQAVLLLKSSKDKAGVECTFTAKTNTSTKGISIGDNIKVKGVIRSGAAYDEDLEMYENVIMEKCDIVK